MKLRNCCKGERSSRWARGLQRHFFALDSDHKTVHLLGQVRHIGCDEVDDAQFQRPIRGGGGGILQRGYSPFHSFLAPPGRQILDVGAKDILDLRLHRFAHILAATAHRTGSANAAAGSHRRYVAGQSDERARTAGLGRGGSHVDHNRYGGCQHILDDAFCDFYTAAWRVQLQNDCTRSAGLGCLNPVHNILVQHRRHRATKAENVDPVHRLLLYFTGHSQTYLTDGRQNQAEEEARKVEDAEV